MLKTLELQSVHSPGNRHGFIKDGARGQFWREGPWPSPHQTKYFFRTGGGGEELLKKKL